MQGPARHREGGCGGQCKSAPRLDELMDGWINGDGYDMCVCEGDGEA